MSIARRMKIWSVYVMAAPHSKGLTYFKIGRSSDVSKRLGQVQTGCPLPITQVFIFTMWGNGAAQAAEWKMHEALAEYRTQGEWFALRTDDLAHKRAMNHAMNDVAERWSPPQGKKKWRKVPVAELKAAVAAHAAEMAAERKVGRTTEARKAMALMASTGRRIL